MNNKRFAYAISVLKWVSSCDSDTKQTYSKQESPVHYCTLFITVHRSLLYTVQYSTLSILYVLVITYKSVTHAHCLRCSTYTCKHMHIVVEYSWKKGNNRMISQTISEIVSKLEEIQSRSQDSLRMRSIGWSLKLISFACA